LEGNGQLLCWRLKAHKLKGERLAVDVGAFRRLRLRGGRVSLMCGDDTDEDTSARAVFASEPRRAPSSLLELKLQSTSIDGVVADAVFLRAASDETFAVVGVS
jgi:hypothetical protein